MRSHYLTEKLGGVVDKEYADAQGRIKLVRKSDQSLKLSLTSAGARTVRASGLRKSAKSVKAVKVSGAKGPVTYKKQSGSKKLSINKKTGKVKIKKGTGKGTYKIKIKVIAAAPDDYRSAEKTKTVKITVSQ